MRITGKTPERGVLEELGRRLEQIRKQQGVTQAALAKDAGIGVATLRRMEDGQDAQLGSWIKILRGLGMVQGFAELLPETYRSPLADVRAETQRTRRNPKDQNGPVWGDEKP